MNGSDDKLKFDSYEHALKWAIDNPWVNGQPNPNNKVITVFKCDVCGEYWFGSHTSKHCDKCRVNIANEQTRKSRERARMRRQMERERRNKSQYVGFSRISYCDMDQKFAASFAVVAKQERIERENQKLIKWNEEHTCPIANGFNGSVQCFYCMRGLPYAGATNLSDRRCPNNPISPDGTRYIQRAKNRKDSDSAEVRGGIRTYDVADNMPQQLKVQLVERMRKLGRELYLWSNGHLDITPEPDSNN